MGGAEQELAQAGHDCLDSPRRCCDLLSRHTLRPGTPQKTILTRGIPLQRPRQEESCQSVSAFSAPAFQTVPARPR